ncbi:MAG: glutamate--tRNA ligase [Coriobacteriales bacterium]|jgi:glutamyl-tRNA synthetase
MSEVRVRFAPSPTGKLHIGGARTAIYNWAFARAMGGKFILRIEDTDPERSTQENIDLIIRALRWLGLDWDEGPEVGGDYGPYLQTKRFDTYTAALEKLKASGNVYPCFCTSEELAQRREAVQKGAERQPDPCRSLSAEEASARIEAGESHVWRLKVPEDRGTIVVHDVIHGDSEFDASLQDDMILVRSDGTPTYNFAVVCDDVNMKMTHIIRGDDHLSNTPRQILVYEALGYPTPVFAHIPMICGPDGKKLSKRHGAASVEEYRDMGYLSDALFNYLALLGWAPDGETTVFSRDEMAEKFTLERVSKNPSSLDFDKLEWMNNHYIQAMGADAFVAAIEPYLASAGYGDADRDLLKRAYPIVAERVKTLDQAVPMLEYLICDELAYDEKSVKKILQKEGKGAKTALVEGAKVLESCDWDTESIESALRDLVVRLESKPRLVFQPIRVAVTGSQVSPPLFESLELLGRERSLARLAKAAEMACD